MSFNSGEASTAATGPPRGDPGVDLLLPRYQAGHDRLQPPEPAPRADPGEDRPRVVLVETRKRGESTTAVVLSPRSHVPRDPSRAALTSPHVDATMSS